jgi:hypothetical protein
VNIDEAATYHEKAGFHRQLQRNFDAVSWDGEMLPIVVYRATSRVLRKWRPRPPALRPAASQGLFASGHFGG